MNQIDRLVRDFHVAMNIPVAETPSVPSDERVRLRARLITEEFAETLEAMFGKSTQLDHAKLWIDAAITQATAVNLTELADGLCDLDYVVAGTRLEFGIPGEAVLEVVHESNMAKLSGPVRADGKKMKPPNWQTPDIAGVLERHGAK